jgi:hypothetical protein
MAPINNPNGNSVSEIILPDGSTASEVIAPDGSTVFSAIPDGLIDNFDESIYEDKSNTLTDYYDGDTGSAQRQASVTIGGSDALEVTGGSSGGTKDTQSPSGSGLPNYPSAGDTFNGYLRADGDNSQAQLFFGYQDPGNTYLIQHSVGNSRILFLKREDGNGSVLNEDDFGPSASTWYQYRTDWQTDGTITVTVFDEQGTQQTTLTISDSTYSSGGIGFGASSSALDQGIAYADEWFVGSV